MKIVRDSAVRQEPAQPQAVSPEENRFSIRPRQIALFFLWMLAFTLLARGTSGALLPEVQLSTPAPNTITQSLTATGTIQWAAGSLFYLPEGLLVEAVFVSEGEAVQEGDKIAALRREDVEQKLRSLQAELAQKQTEYARLTKPVAADSYDLEKAQQALQAAYQAAENSAAAWAEKQANAGSERDALQRELNERQEKAAQYAREIAEKQAQRELLQQEESPDEEIISRIEAELTQLTAEETQNREALAEAEARLNEADAALESVQSQREEAARTAAQAAEQAEQARNDARHAYEKSVEAASETAAANAASATVLAEQIREMESSVETLKKLDEQEGVFCAPQTGTVESLQLMQGQTSGQVGGSISDPERGYQIRFALEAEDAVQDTAGVTVTVMQGAKSESVKINSSVSQQDGGVVLSAALTGSDWQVEKRNSQSGFPRRNMTAACRSAPFTVITAGISSIRWRSATLFWGCKTSCARFMWRSWSATTSWRPCGIIRPVRRWWPPQRRACRRAHVCVQRDEDSKGGAAFGMRGFLGDRCLVCGEAVGSLSAGFGALRRAGHGAAAGSAAVCFAAGGWGERACSRFLEPGRGIGGKPLGNLRDHCHSILRRV